MDFSISPFLIQFTENFGVRYYSLVYLLGLFSAYWWLTRIGKYDKNQIADLCVYGFLWVIVGARLGYVLFYQPQWLTSTPLTLFAIWEGGMSFHGGLIAAILWFMYSIKKKRWGFWAFSDTLVIPVMFALGLGRIGNFLNGELWGRVTDVAWCFNVPGWEGCRHPSQLYQTASDWIVVGLLLWLYFRPHKKGQVSALFLVGYGISRSINEIFWREPSWVWAGITAGTWLSIPMIFVGLMLLYKRSSSS